MERSNNVLFDCGNEQRDDLKGALAGWLNWI